MRRNGKSFIILLISAVLLITPMISAVNSPVQEDGRIEKIISMTNDKFLYKNERYGNILVQYWTHEVYDITIKNDYMLLQENPNGEVIKFEREWTDIENLDVDLSSIKFCHLQIEDSKIYWQSKVLFPEKIDCKNFYTFSNPRSFPLPCWEVRYIDGSTVMYDLEGKEIGYGVPAPSNGFTMSGFHEQSYPDPWLEWRLNAKSWYSKWCDSTVGVSFPPPSLISSYISNPDYELFFEIAHGGSTYFKATETEYYYSSDVTNAISGRNPMRFAFIGSCGGMDSTGAGTWSYEFRKGQYQDTVTVGYTGMGSCPGWSVSLEWQDTMFYAMNSGETVMSAFNFASAQYPTIADCVVFVGDPIMRIYNETGGDVDHDFRPPNVIILQPVDNSYVYRDIIISGKAIDIDGTIERVYIKIDDGEWEKATGTNTWEYNLDTTLLENGHHTIKAISVDNQGIQSGTDSIQITVSNLPLFMEITVPETGYINEKIQYIGYGNGGIPPYLWNWSLGDGTTSKEKNPIHTYKEPGEYQIMAVLTDSENTTLTKTSSIMIKERDITPPELTIIQPTDNFYINNENVISFFTPLIIGPIDIKVKANDYQSGIETVTVYVNDEILNNLNSEQYTWTWSESFFGQFTIKVEAKDKVGNINQLEISGWKFF